jgi:hypothetical protein
VVERPSLPQQARSRGLTPDELAVAADNEEFPLWSYCLPMLSSSFLRDIASRLASGSESMRVIEAVTKLECGGAGALSVCVRTGK